VGVRAGATHVELAGGRDDGDDWIATALRLHFGASRQARRAAADRRADEAFSARLGREIEVRQARQIETWLDEAAQAAHDRDHARAVVLYRNVLLLQADAAAARDGLARAQRALLLARADSLTAAGDPAAATVMLEDIVRQFPEDSLATQRLAVTRKAVRRADRSRNEAAEQLRLGLDAYASQQYATAVRYLESARDRDPGNVTVRELLQQARAAHERQLTATLAQARARLDQGDPDEARRLVESVLAVAPKRPQAVALRTEIERESARLAEKRVAVRSSDEVAREDRAPVPPAVLSSGYQQGMQLYRAGDLVAAMRAWEDLARLAPHYADVDQYLLRVYRVCGLERYTEGRLQDAIEIWEKALRLEPNNAQVRRYLNQANAKMKRAHEPRGKQ
jgi:tetratricopeptide (TPR) repeat protein